MIHAQRKVEWCLRKAEKEMLERVASMSVDNHSEKIAVSIREEYQYGTGLSIKDNIYRELLNLAREIISGTKVIIQASL